jgi:hypothetical protein
MKSINNTTSTTENTLVTAPMEISHKFIKTLIPQLVIFLQSIKESGLEKNDEKLNIVEEVIKTLLTMNTVANDTNSKYTSKEYFICFKL